MSTSTVVSTSTSTVVSSADPGRIAQPSSELTRRPINRILPTVLFPEIFKFLPVFDILTFQDLCRDCRTLPAHLDFRDFPGRLVEIGGIQKILERPQRTRIISLKLPKVMDSEVAISDLVARKGKLGALQTLEFRGIDGTMQGLSGLPITDLDLRQSELSEGFFQQVEFPELRCLRLGECSGINPEFIQSLSQFPKLQQLELDDSELTDAEILCLNAPSLERLNVDWNMDLSNAALTVAAKCCKLTSLTFGGWDIDDGGLESIPHLALRELSICQTAITGTGLLNLQIAKTSLETLSLQTCKQIKAADLMIFRQLQTLSLRDTNVNDGEMQALANLPRLQTLKLLFIEKHSVTGFEKLAESSSLLDVITVGQDMPTVLRSLDPKRVSESCITFTIRSEYVGKCSYKFLPRKEKTQAFDLGIKPD